MEQSKQTTLIFASF